MTEDVTIWLDERSMPRSRLLARARQAAAGFAALGVREGDVVAILMRNDFAFMEAQQAAAEAGAYCVPINWHGKADEIRYVLEDAEPKVLVAHADLLAQLRGGIPAAIRVLVAPTPPEILARYPVDPDAARPAADDVVWDDWLAGFAPLETPARRLRATMIYTSGTTGHPKGVRREPATPEQAAANAGVIARVYGLVPGVRSLICGPLYHASPNAFVRQALPNSAVLVVHTKFDAEATLAAIERHRITHAVMVPAMFIRLLKLPPEVRAKYDVSSIRWVTHTGAPCPAEVKREFMQWWGPVVYETYGGTEVGTATLATPEDSLRHPGSVGVPLPETTLAFYDEAGNRLPEGEVGEIYMRNVAYSDFTYHRNPEKRRSVERDGLISVGDIGYLKDGHLYLCDRRSDMVIFGGTNVYPAEIEKVLAQCPGVQDCAVFGIPDDDFGEALCAAIEPMPGAALTAEDVKAWLKARVASYKVPRKVDFHAALPRQDSGKIFKRVLRDPYWKDAGRRI